MYSLDAIYGEVDKIRNLRLEEDNEKFVLMNERQILELAITIVEKIEKSKYRTVVFAESGSAPLIRICEKVANERGIEIKWFGFKIPRDIDIDLYQFIKFYLTKEELMQKKGLKTRAEILKEFCERIDLEKYLPRKELLIDEILREIGKEYEGDSLDEILSGTYLYEVFSKEFLFFDEYFLSGTIARNFSFFSKLICKKSKFKIAAYMIVSDNVENINEIEFSLYSQKNMMEAYRKGVYPYEDRIDIIGYFYNITSSEYCKIYIKDFIVECENKKREMDIFIQEIYEFIEEKELLSMIKSRCRKEMLKVFFNKEDIVRFVLKSFEQSIASNSKEAIFLDEVFELYAPIWLPMPKEYHYQYWKGLVRIQNCIDEFIEERKEKYKEIRVYFLSKLACKILQKVI